MIVIFYKTEEKQAERIANGLLEERLANSIDQLSGVKSFSWTGTETVINEEVLLVIKTKALLYSKVEAKIKELSASDNPKMYSLPMTQIDEKYREQLREGVLEV